MTDLEIDLKVAKILEKYLQQIDHEIDMLICKHPEYGLPWDLADALGELDMLIYSIEYDANEAPSSPTKPHLQLVKK